MGRTEWQAENLLEAVKWWIRSIVIRVSTDTFDDVEPFLYLSYVAETLGFTGACSALREIVNQIHKVGLNVETAEKLYAATHSQGTPSLKKAIDLLQRQFLGVPESEGSVADGLNLRVIVFLEGQKPPPEPERYCWGVVSRKYREQTTRIKAWRVVGLRHAMRTKEVMMLYENDRNTGALPDWGTPADSWEGRGADSKNVVALFFH
jgi:hypothetical protein